jgi:hypothetical protein
MEDETGLTKAGQQYEAAQHAQYTKKDLLSALGIYTDLIAAHPNAPEAAYSRAQLQNIANSVVPKEELLYAHVQLALAHLGKKTRPAGEPALVMPLVADVPGWNI